MVSRLPKGDQARVVNESALVIDTSAEADLLLMDHRNEKADA